MSISYQPLVRLYDRNSCSPPFTYSVTGAPDSTGLGGLGTEGKTFPVRTITSLTRHWVLCRDYSKRLVQEGVLKLILRRSHLVTVLEFISTILHVNIGTQIYSSLIVLYLIFLIGIIGN